MTHQNDAKLQRMRRHNGWRTHGRYAAVLSLIVCAAFPLSAATGQVVANTVPRFVSTAANLGPADTSATIDVSIWLNLQNRAGLDALAKELYNPSSPNYRHWLTPASFAAQYGPTAEDVSKIKQFFQAHKLQIIRVGPNNMYVRARGTLGQVQKAFQVQINNYSLRGSTYRAPATDPIVDGAAAGLARAVSGLDSAGFTHPLVTRPASLPGTSNAAPATVSPDFFTSNCFPGVVTQTYNTYGTYPEGTFSGNGYVNSATDPGPGCGYVPSSLATAYNLTGLYNEGYDGTGQTIAIIDWCGSPTIQKDANAFSQKFGLPQLTSSNFTITEVPTPSQCSGPDTEINLDVEWSHAVAPGASINLVVPPSNLFEDIDEAESDIVNSALGTVISGSYAAIESEIATSELENENLINEEAAVFGISANFSSGDDGDYSVYGIPPSVSNPADGTYATAVGGVSVKLNSDNAIVWQEGWGNNEVLLAEPGIVFDPPLSFGFYAGAGGGPSGYFGKPAYQSALPGTWRMLPDISWVADPWTGVAILMTEPGDAPPQVWSVIGGTSVSCPMFSALWAIANQEAGGLLGQAAAYVYTLPAGAVTDVVPVDSHNNVTANISETSGSTTKYTSGEVLGGAEPSKYFDILWDYPYEGGIALVISFGTDCTAYSEGFGTLCTAAGALQAAPGWDNVTGVGTPNAKAFADSFKP